LPPAATRPPRPPSAPTRRSSDLGHGGLPCADPCVVEALEELLELRWVREVLREEVRGEGASATLGQLVLRSPTRDREDARTHGADRKSTCLNSSHVKTSDGASRL